VESRELERRSEYLRDLAENLADIGVDIIAVPVGSLPVMNIGSLDSYEEHDYFDDIKPNDWGPFRPAIRLREHEVLGQALFGIEYDLNKVSAEKFLQAIIGQYSRDSMDTVQVISRNTFVTLHQAPESDIQQIDNLPDGVKILPPGTAVLVDNSEGDIVLLPDVQEWTFWTIPEWPRYI